MEIQPLDGIVIMLIGMCFINITIGFYISNKLDEIKFMFKEIKKK